MLKTERLILREPRAEDLDAMFAAYSDPQAMRYWSTPPHETPDVTQTLLDGRIAHWAKAQVNFQIELDGHYIGNAGNYARNEVGFMLQRQFWRQSILTEAMEAIVPYLWEVTDHDHLFADADPLNAASCGLLTSLGFHETHRAERTFCINGLWSDSVYFRLNRPT
ncbi:GNAT family N-acetyltransferase [Pseudooctadecabacter jejudonensis]|uniref:Ribosomal-protein-S5-alanine N-acetyltransferase n=1 Tax=Pseudooctadecabacter jejudonensis TaxID=1391910 RepID=A0A1Y5RAA3_9RHOB|nr:GNAT family N-acetyltransferase [Pseudooctadecabacter jejudonensis]SLN12765.1 ribosomal-protein-S5-alanine N-acetyltransferase [Pseudooctadecabacter jejudonensis]